MQRRATRYTPLWLPEPAGTMTPRPQPALGQALNCYVCKQPFTLPHRYYDSLCRDCGDFNYAKREQTADLSGHYALVTGARVKIGFQAALKLLRAGAHVIVTTRFPVDAAERYAQEPDYRAVQGAPADPRPGSAPLAERRALHPLPARAAAAARLHPEQCLPDRAPPRGILRAPAGKRRPACQVAALAAPH